MADLQLEFAGMAKQYQFTYSKWDELLASPTEPIETEKRTHQLLRIYEGLHNLETAEEPSYEDWRMCSDAVNMADALVELDIIQDPTGVITAAAQALGRAGQRSLDGSAIRLDGTGIAAVRDVVAEYAELLEQLPKRTIITAHRHAERRLQNMLIGRSQPKDVRLKARPK